MHTFDKISLQISFCSDANLVLITSDCCEGPPANAFLDCFDFVWAYRSDLKSKQSRESFPPTRFISWLQIFIKLCNSRFLKTLLGFLNVFRKEWLLHLNTQSVILPLTRSYQLSEDLTLGSRWMTNISISSNPCWKTKWPLVKVTVLYLTKYRWFNKFNFNTSFWLKNSWKRWCFWNFLFLFLDKTK